MILEFLVYGWAVIWCNRETASIRINHSRYNPYQCQDAACRMPTFSNPLMYDIRYLQKSGIGLQNWKNLKLCLIFRIPRLCWILYCHMMSGTIYASSRKHSAKGHVRSLCNPCIILYFVSRRMSQFPN